MSDFGAPLRIALLGDGVIAAEHAAALSAIGCRPRVVLGARPDRARGFAAAHGIDRWTTSLADALDREDVDAVVIASPNDQHETQAIAAAERGQHVLCEVPLATSMAGATAVADAVAAAGVVGMVGQTQRYLPAITHLRALSRGGLDPLQIISVTGLRRRRAENLGWQGAQRDWVDSVIWHHGSHAVDTALWLLNDTVETVRAGAARPDPADGRPVDFSACLQTRSGRIATLTLSYSARQPVNELIVIGDTQTHWLSGGVPRGLVQAGDQPGPDAAVRAAISAQDRVFVESAAGRAEPSPSPAELLPMFEVLAEIERQVTARLKTLQSRDGSAGSVNS